MDIPAMGRSKGPTAIVVGAGAVGLFAALALAERGAAVTVVEADGAGARARRAARSASLAAAGMLGGYSESLYDGPSTHRLLPKLCAAGLAAWDEVALRAPALRRAIRRTGALLLAHGDADAARVLRVRDRAVALGAMVQWSDKLPADLDPHLYSLRVRAAVELPQESVVDPVEATAALETMVVEAGGSFLREREVTHLAVKNGQVRGVALADGSGLTADIVVLAPGAFAPAALAEAAPALQRITPAKGMLGAVEPVGAVTITHTVRSMGAYALPNVDGEIIFGASMEFGRADLEPDPAALETLFTGLRRILPGARFEGPPRTLVVGVRPMSPDWAPLVGPSGPKGCYVSCGHSRNGWLLAPLTAKMLAAQVFQEPADELFAAFLPDRFEKKAA